MSTISYKNSHSLESLVARSFSKYRLAFHVNYSDLLNDINDYYVFIEISGLKLPHYAGLVVANYILPWVEPGSGVKPCASV